MKASRFLKWVPSGAVFVLILLGALVGGAGAISLVLALCAAILSTVLGTAASVGMNKLRSKYMRAAMNTVTNLPMVNPEIITGISLMLMFVFVHCPLTKWTMLCAHVAFDTPYVLFSVLPRLRQMDPNLYEAALDLGARPSFALRKVVLPEIMPGIITGMLLSFTLSIDDFIISYFTKGTGVQTLPIVIYSMTRRKVTPKVNALSTLLFVVVLALLIIVNLRQSRADIKKQQGEERR